MICGCKVVSRMAMNVCLLGMKRGRDKRERYREGRNEE